MSGKGKGRRPLGGVVADRMIFEDAKDLRNSGERLTSFGYFRLGGKRFVITAYFPTRKYWWRFIRNFPTHMSSFIFPSAYQRSLKIDELVRGIRVYDEKSRFVKYERGLYSNAFRAVRVWIRVYLDPFYPPKPRYFEAKLKVIRRIAKASEFRHKSGMGDETNAYVDAIRKADDQMLRYLVTFEKHNNLLRGLASAFVSVSDNPSSINMDDLFRKAQRFKDLLGELQTICEDRARSWPDVRAARAALENLWEGDDHPLRKYGPRALTDGIIGVIFGVLSGGSLAVGFLFSVSSELGFGFLRHFVLSPKRQVASLLKESESYQKAIERAQDFLSLYKLNPSNELFRA